MKERRKLIISFAFLRRKRRKGSEKKDDWNRDKRAIKIAPSVMHRGGVRKKLLMLHEFSRLHAQSLSLKNAEGPEYKAAKEDYRSQFNIEFFFAFSEIMFLWWQLFFIASSLLRCELITKQQIKYCSRQDEHDNSFSSGNWIESWCRIQNKAIQDNQKKTF